MVVATMFHRLLFVKSSFTQCVMASTITASILNVSIAFPQRPTVSKYIGPSFNARKEISTKKGHFLLTAIPIHLVVCFLFGPASDSGYDRN